jgi:hypothetical protein
MPGPTPKPSATRQRTNKTSTAAKLSLAPSGIKPPTLPKRKDDRGKFVKWHPRTVDWWKSVWASPMAVEFLDSDVHGLLTLAELEDEFHKSTDTRTRLDLVKEIRLQRQAFGLTPIDRRRLQWEVERVKGAEEKTTKKRGRPKKDPREYLRAVE